MLYIVGSRDPFAVFRLVFVLINFDVIILITFRWELSEMLLCLVCYDMSFSARFMAAVLFQFTWTALMLQHNKQNSTLF